MSSILIYGSGLRFKDIETKCVSAYFKDRKRPLFLEIRGAKQGEDTGQRRQIP